MKYFIEGVKNYFNFKGRASRKEFWMYNLFYLISLFAVTVVDIIFLGSDILPVLFNIALAIPSLAIQIRRLHDVNKSGWIYLVSLIPFGSIYILILSCKKGNESENRFGYPSVA